MEIERKWRAQSPDILKVIRDLPAQNILQSYVITRPGELRIRSDGSTYWLTAKSDGDLVREEFEIEIPAWLFDQLFATTTHQIQKRRYRVDINDQIWEIDVYDGRLNGLIIIEAECNTESRATALQPPAEFGTCTDVTHDPSYKNKVIAVKGLPD